MAEIWSAYKSEEEGLKDFDKILTKLQDARALGRERANTADLAKAGIDYQELVTELEKAFQALEDRQKEVQLAAEIGKALLDRNNELETKVKKYEDERSSLKFQLNTLQKQYQEIVELNEGQSQEDVLRKATEMSDKISELKTDNDSLRKKVTQLKSQIDTAEETRISISNDLYNKEEALKQKQVEAETANSLKENVKEMKEQIEGLKSEYEKVKESEQDLRKKATKLSEEKVSLTEKNRELSLKLDSVLQDLGNLKSTINSEKKNEKTQETKTKEVKDQVQKLTGEKERLEKMISILIADSQRLTQELDETNGFVEALRKENEELMTNSADPNSIKKNSIKISFLDEIQDDLVRRGNTKGNLPLITPRAEAPLYTPRGVNLVAFTPRKPPMTARESSKNLRRVIEAQRESSPGDSPTSTDSPQAVKPNLKLNLSTAISSSEKMVPAEQKKDDKKEDYSEDLEDFDYSFHGYFFLLAKAIHIALVLKHKDDDAIATISSRNDKTFWKLYEEVEEKRIAFHEWHDNEWIRNEINSRLIKVHK